MGRGLPCSERLVRATRMLRHPPEILAKATVSRRSWASSWRVTYGMPEALSIVRPARNEGHVNEPAMDDASREAMSYLRRKGEHLNVF